MTRLQLGELLGAAGLGNHVHLVKHDDHLVVGDLADDQTLGRLCLDALVHVDHQDHQVDDLGAADDRADE